MNKGPYEQGFGGGSKNGLAQGMSLAFEFAGAVFIFWFLGRLVDNWLDTEPWFQVIGAVIGWVGGILHVYYKSQAKNGGGGKQ